MFITADAYLLALTTSSPQQCTHIPQEPGFLKKGVQDHTLIRQVSTNWQLAEWTIKNSPSFITHWFYRIGYYNWMGIAYSQKVVGFLLICGATCKNRQLMRITSLGIVVLVNHLLRVLKLSLGFAGPFSITRIWPFNGRSGYIKGRITLSL